MQKKSFMPPSRWSDLERCFWAGIPQEHRGKKMSLDELKKLFPKTDDLDDVEILQDNENYRVYGQKDKTNSQRRLAYQCKHCESIIVGMPEVNEFNDLGVQPLAGRRGYSLSCKECYREIKGFSGQVS
jgi:hypothetical protein